MSDLMWSDPQPFAGRSPSKRGVGMAFGPDVTKAFLDGNDLKLLVRSHEVKEVSEIGGLTVSAPRMWSSWVGSKGVLP